MVQARQRMNRPTSTPGFALLLALLLLTVCTAAGAQELTTGSIVGVVKDVNGAAVPAATVTVTNKGTGAQRTVTASGEGEFSVPGLPPAVYDLRVESAGFSAYLVSALELKINQTARVEAVLQPGQVTDTVMVTGGAVLLETETSAQGQVIGEQQIRELPLNGRNITQLATLAAGTSPPAPGLTTQYGQRQQFVTIEGGRDSSTNYLVDGVGARSNRFNNLSLQLNVDTIQEFKVNRNTFSAEFGQGQSVVTAATKSGENTFHGTAYDFLRNDNFDARNAFDGAEKPEFRRNQFGGTLGGPVIKKKAFFFGAYEGLRALQGRTSFQQTVNAAQLAGNFSALPDPTFIGIGYLCPVAECRPVDPQTGQPFPGGIIPAARVSQFARVLNRTIPTSAGGQLVPVVRNFLDSYDQVTVRTDQTLSQKHTIFQRYIWYSGDQTVPGLFAQANPQKGQNLALSSTYTVTPTLVNELKLGYNRAVAFIQPADSNGNPVQEAGLRNLVGATNPIDFGFPSVVVGSFNNISTQAAVITQGARENNYTVGDNLSKVFASHTLKVGAELQHRRFSQLTDVNPRGLFAFIGVPTFLGSGSTTNAVADYLLGTPIFATGQAGDSSGNYRSNFFGSFVQDDWRVNQRLTLNLGLRYEYGAPWREENNQEGFFDPATGLITFHEVPANIPAALRGSINPQEGLVPAGIITPDRNNFAPRVGLAWRPFGDETVVRAGFGVFYDNTNLNELQFTRLLPPFTSTYNLSPLAGSGQLSTATLFPDVNELTSFPAPFSLDPRNRTPYTEQYNVNVQHTFARSWLLEVGYAGSQAHKLWKRYDQNQSDPVTGLRPFPQFSVGLLTSVNSSNSNYNGGYLKVERSYSNGLFFLTNYTLSKTIDDGSGELGNINGGDARDRRNFGLDRGRSLFDQRHRFVSSFGYELPFGKGKKYLGGIGGAADKLVSGWTVNGILGLYSGRPFSVIDNGATSSGGSLPTFPNRVCGGEVSNPTQGRWFDTSCFVSTPQAATGINVIGNAGRNILDGPGYKNFDLSVTKNTYLTEQVRIQFRAEFFNVFNFVNFGQPVADLNSPQAGQILSAADPRQIQFGLKLIF